MLDGLFFGCCWWRITSYWRSTPSSILRYILVEGFKLHSFQLQAPYRSLYCYFHSFRRRIRTSNCLSRLLNRNTRNPIYKYMYIYMYLVCWLIEWLNDTLQSSWFNFFFCISCSISSFVSNLHSPVIWLFINRIE